MRAFAPTVRSHSDQTPAITAQATFTRDAAPFELPHDDETSTCRAYGTMRIALLHCQSRNHHETTSSASCDHRKPGDCCGHRRLYARSKGQHFYCARTDGSRTGSAGTASCRIGTCGNSGRTRRGHSEIRGQHESLRRPDLDRRGRWRSHQWHRQRADSRYSAWFPHP